MTQAYEHAGVVADQVNGHVEELEAPAPGPPVGDLPRGFTSLEELRGFVHLSLSKKELFLSAYKDALVEWVEKRPYKELLGILGYMAMSGGSLKFLQARLGLAPRPHGLPRRKPGWPKRKRVKVEPPSTNGVGPLPSRAVSEAEEVRPQLVVEVAAPAATEGRRPSTSSGRGRPTASRRRLPEDAVVFDIKVARGLLNTLAMSADDKTWNEFWHSLGVLLRLTSPAPSVGGS